MKRRLSGNHPVWLARVAREIREAGKPVSLQFLLDVVPGQFATATNDGHVTAAENGLPRDDYEAGWRIWVEEAVAALKQAKLVDGPDDELVWAASQDGTWKVRFGNGTPTVYGQAESAAARDRHMLGEEESPGYLLKGWSEVPVEVEVGIANVITKGRHVLEAHPLALAIPAMSRADQEAVRADIEKHGVRMPLVLYPDRGDKTVRGKPKLKVLDGRHRLQFASALGRPVRVELFEGTEEEARDYVASLNLQRRQLTTAQRALAIEQLFGAEAREETKKAQIRKPEPGGSVRAGLPEQNGGESNGGRWEDRAVKKGGGGVSPRAVRYMADVAQAPETVEKVNRGEITTVSEAVKAAAAERGQPEPADIWGTARTELARARGHMRNVVDRLGLSTEAMESASELAPLLDEIVEMAGQIRRASRERTAQIVR